MKFTKPGQVLEAWLSGVNAGALDAVTGLYGTSAVLLPTFANKILSTVNSRGEYFVQLGSKRGLQIELHPETLSVQKLHVADPSEDASGDEEKTED